MIPIYKAEASVKGLAEQILANASVAYNVGLEPWADDDRTKVMEYLGSNRFTDNLEALAKQRSWASVTDRDLFFTKSVFVSTNWNKNDDVFAPQPVWAARHTPAHKPTNLEHDETKLVGHITDTWALDNDGNLIPDNTVIDDLPAFYHIANGAVIYTSWADDDLKERTAELIGQIQAGTKFVSMEALFTDFSYAVKTPEDEYHVVARCPDTAFLTKHLRIYGGSGEFDGCTVGRLLRNITFSGKGYVDNPANPYSVLFNDKPAFNLSKASTKNPFNPESGVSISCKTNLSKELENTSMSDTHDLITAQNTVASLSAKVEEMTQAASKAGIKSLEDKIVALEAKVTATEAALEESKAASKTVGEEKAAVQAELEEVTKAKVALETEVTEAKAAKAKADRVSKLVSGGVDQDTAIAKVEVYAALSDEQFESVSADVIAVANFGKKDDDKKDKDKDKDKCKSSDDDATIDPADAAATASTIDNADAGTVDPALAADATDSEDSDLEETRAELSKALASRLGYSTKEEKDGE